MNTEPKEISVTPLYFDQVYGKFYKVIVMIGGRFSSKTFNSQVERADNMMTKKDYKLLVIEDLEGNLKDGYYAGLKDKIESFGHEEAYNINKSPTEITNNLNKNVALFRGYKSEAQKKSVKAIDQVTEIVVEEGEWLEYEDFVSLLHQIRPKEEKDGKLTIIMNPVNEQCFVNQMFIQTPPNKVIEYFPNSKRPKVFEKDIVTEFSYEGKEYKDVTTVLIVLSTHHDNPFLTVGQRATIEKLKETDPDRYLQLGEARFVKPAGAYFHEFNKEIHVVEPFLIPETWTRYRALDYGLDMLACLWFAVDPFNNVYAYKELHESNLIISDAAEKILDYDNGDKIRLTYAPPDMWSRNSDTGRTKAETFALNGVNFYKSSNNRIQGWYAVKEALKILDSKDEITGDDIKVAKLRIFDNCTNLINNLPNIQKDKKEPNDCANIPHDITHICDALRGFCVTRFNIYIEEEKPQKNNIINTYINEINNWG